jgi:hypothetical protein
VFMWHLVDCHPSGKYISKKFKISLYLVIVNNFNG